MPPKVVKPISESVEKEEVQAKKPPVKKTSTVTVKTPAAAKIPQTTQDKSTNSAVESRVKLPTGSKTPVKTTAASATEQKPKATVAPVRKPRATKSLVTPIENVRNELELANLNETPTVRNGRRDPNDIAIVQRVSATIANSQFDNETLTKIRPLGRGAQGSVYLVDAGHFTKVAYKLVDGNLTSKNERELRILLRTASHPHIVTFYDFVKKRSKLQQSRWISDGIRGGHESKHRLFEIYKRVIYDRRKNYDFPTIVRWCREASGALVHLHQKQIIHRDVKPHNMLLTMDKRLKLCDFGLAKGFSLRNTTGCGTESYMAPEVVKPTSHFSQYDDKCDVYSLAICVWEIISRKDPHEDFKTGFMIMEGTLAGFRPPADEITDSGVRNIVVRAWNQDPILRPSITEVYKFFTSMSV